MITRLGPVSVFFFGLLVSASAVPATTIDGIAASVNGEVITLLELETAGKPLVEQKLRTTLKRERAKVKREVLSTVLDKLILRALQLQRARQLGIRVSDQEVDKAIALVMQNNSLTDDMLARALEEQGLTEEKYREQISDQVFVSKLMQHEIQARVAVTPEELEHYYREHEKDYYKPERIRVRHLFVEVGEDASEADVQAKRRRALDILEEFRGGADFVDLIRKYSPASASGEDSTSAWLRRGEFLSELEDVAFALPAGQVSDPIRSQSGFHLIQVVEKEEAAQLALETVADTIREKLTREKMDGDYDLWLQELREESQIEILY